MASDDDELTREEAAEKLKAVKSGNRPGVVSFDAYFKTVRQDILPRIEALETWRCSVDEKLLSLSPGASLKDHYGLIGVPGLEALLDDILDGVSTGGYHKGLAEFFFTRLTHHERVRVFLEAGAVTVYIANDPVYYQQALELLEKDSSIATAVFVAIRRLRSHRRECVRNAFGPHICGSCERTTETTQVGRQWFCGHCQQLEQDRPNEAKEEDPLEGYQAICDYVVEHFGDEQRPDQTISGYVLDLLAAVAKGKE